MNDNPNTNKENNNIDDILEILRKRREQENGNGNVNDNNATRMDTESVKLVSDIPKSNTMPAPSVSKSIPSDMDATRIIPAKDLTKKASSDFSSDKSIPKAASAEGMHKGIDTPIVSVNKPTDIAGGVIPPAPKSPDITEATIISPVSVTSPDDSKKVLEENAVFLEMKREKEEKKAKKEKAEKTDINMQSGVSLNDFDGIPKLAVKKLKQRTKEKVYVPGYVKVILYLAVVLTISIVASITAVFVGNDVFAFKKDKKDYKLNVSEAPSWDKIAEYFDNATDSSFNNTPFENSEKFLFGDYATLDTVAEALYDSGVIEYPDVFKIFAQFRMDGKAQYSGRFVPGEYDIIGTDESQILNYDNLIELLAENKYKRETVRVTIPEGYCVYEILDLLEANNVIDKSSREKLAEKLNSEYYDYSFLPKPKEDENTAGSDIDRYEHLAVSFALLDVFEETRVLTDGERAYFEKEAGNILDKYAPAKPKIDENKIYNLEGYLFPDTYEFYVGEDLDSIVNKFLANFEIKYEDTFYTTEEERTPTIEEIKDVITLASIIQAEGNNSADFYLISNVFHNRLEHPEGLGRVNPILESDATSVYALQGAMKRSEISAELIKTIDSPFNTYTNEGLPPGPVCNPGHDAIHAALYPAEYVTTVDENGDVNKVYVDYYYFYAASSNGKTYFSETFAQHNAFIEADKRGDIEALERLQIQVNS